MLFLVCCIAREVELVSQCYCSGGHNSMVRIFTVEEAGRVEEEEEEEEG